MAYFPIGINDDMVAHVISKDGQVRLPVLSRAVCLCVVDTPFIVVRIKSKSGSLSVAVLT